MRRTSAQATWILLALALAGFVQGGRPATDNDSDRSLANESTAGAAELEHLPGYQREATTSFAQRNWPTLTKLRPKRTSDYRFYELLTMLGILRVKKRVEADLACRRNLRRYLEKIGRRRRSTADEASNMATYLYRYDQRPCTFELPVN
ncbi:hypothetical protein HN011_009707 [Eciton burchellii]|nr:hypothetical protein HN011_009707 [Eciton burchellii]